MNSLHEAVYKKNLQLVQQLVQQGTDINEADEQGNTPLMLAVIVGDLSQVDYFLTQRTIDLYKKNNNKDIALSLSRRGNLEIIKRLVIKHVTDDADVQTSIEDDIQTLINKLITTLLYKSKRKEWGKRDCYNLRYYISALNPQFENATQSELESHIRRQETKTGDFYGSYLSDDSDSDEEKAYHYFSEPTQKKLKTKSKKYQKCGQIDNLFYKRRTGERLKGDIKPINEASKIFDLVERTRIHPGKKDKPNTILRDLNHLNLCLARGETLEEAQRQVTTVFYCAQYRGVTHLTSKWNKDSRRAHRTANEIGQAQYSASVLSASGIEIYNNYSEARQLIEQNEDILEQRAKVLKEVLLTLREPRPCSYNNYSYVNFAYLLQNIYTQDYDEFHRLLKEDPLLQSLFFNGANPFVSTGDIPYHALKYAYGIKPYQGHENERLRPRWKKNGKAERPYSGVVYVSLHPITDYDHNGPLHLVSLNRSAEIKLKSELNIMPERESCFPAYIPKDRVIYKHVAKYLSFSGAYKQIYASKYGINKSFYKRLKKLLSVAKPHSDKMTEFKKILGEWLCSYYEVKLIDIARKEAKARGGVLIYRDINQKFALVPPIDSVNRNTNLMTADIKLPCKAKQAFRQKKSCSSNDAFTFIKNQKDIDAMTQDMSRLTLSTFDDFSVLNEENSKIPIQLSIAIGALKNKYYLGLQQFLDTPTLRTMLNHTFSTYQLENASLMHMAVLLNDAYALNLLLSRSQMTINVANETINDRFHDVNYYENMSALALAIIEKKHELIFLMLHSHRFDLNETVCCVVNKHLIHDTIAELSSDDEDDLGASWSCKEILRITRTRRVSLLHLAVEYGRLEIVNQLLAANAPCNIRNSQGDTALDLAVFDKKYDMAAALINAGAIFSTKDSHQHCLKEMPRTYRRYINTIDTTDNTRPDHIPEDIHQFLVALKRRFFNEHTDNHPYVPALQFFKLSNSAVAPVLTTVVDSGLCTNIS